MKLVEHFNTFMTDVVNLNDKRIGLLEDSIEALKTVIRDSNWEPRGKRFASQGSWAHKTIIKPVAGNAFDADLLVFVQPVAGWAAKNYISTLRAVFAGNPVYKDKVRRFSHCVTIEYAGERKIDIAPCVVDRRGAGSFDVCNFNTDVFEPSEPERYTAWLVERNGWTGQNGLRKVTRLLKYLRDIKETFTCQSVLFTTLVGERITSADDSNFADFVDLPTSLKTIVGRLDDWLQARSARPSVPNPFLWSENFGDLWTDAQYTNFRDKIHTYRGWIDDAFAEADRDESIGKWQRVFGEEFAKGAVADKAAKVSDDARVIAENSALVQRGFTGDLVTLFTRFGRQVLPAYFDRLPYKQRPRWRTLPTQFRVNVVANRHSTRGGTRIDTVASGQGPLPKGDWLNFQARTTVGTPVGPDYTIHWRVTNTDREAIQANQLRGGFDDSNDGSTRWELLQFRGVHSVEAFVVRDRDQAIVAQSEPFYVVIS